MIRVNPDEPLVERRKLFIPRPISVSRSLWSTKNCDDNSNSDNDCAGEETEKRDEGTEREEPAQTATSSTKFKDGKEVMDNDVVEDTAFSLKDVISSNDTG